MTVSVGRIGHICGGRWRYSDMSHSERYTVEVSVKDSCPDRARRWDKI